MTQERINLAVKGLSEALARMVHAEKQLDTAQRERSAASIGLRIANEEVRSITDEIRNPA